MTTPTEDLEPATARLMAEATDRQVAYAARRREWAEAVGRPYKRRSDLRPPPGELDATADADD